MGGVISPETELIIRMRPRLRAHVRQDRLRDAHHAKEIGFELAPPILHARVFHRRNINNSGIIDQHIQPAGLGDDAGHAIFDRSIIDNVHVERFERQIFLARPGIQQRALFRRAPRRKYAVTTLRQQHRGRFAQTIGRAGNQYCF